MLRVFQKILIHNSSFPCSLFLRLLRIKLQHVLPLSGLFPGGDSQALQGFVPGILSSCPDRLSVTQSSGGSVAEAPGSASPDSGASAGSMLTCV